MKPKLAHTSKTSRVLANRVLAEARSYHPTQVVIWYQSDDGRTGVLVSEGVERVKAVGALNAAAYDVWIS